MLQGATPLLVAAWSVAPGPAAVLLAAIVRLGGGHSKCTFSSRKSGVVDDHHAPGSSFAILVTDPTIPHLCGTQGTGTPWINVFTWTVVCQLGPARMEACLLAWRLRLCGGRGSCRGWSSRRERLWRWRQQALRLARWLETGRAPGSWHWCQWRRAAVCGRPRLEVEPTETLWCSAGEPGVGAGPADARRHRMTARLLLICRETVLRLGHIISQFVDISVFWFGHKKQNRCGHRIIDPVCSQPPEIWWVWGKQARRPTMPDSMLTVRKAAETTKCPLRTCVFWRPRLFSNLLRKEEVRCVRA